MHRIHRGHAAELRVDDARNELDAFHRRVLEMRLEMSLTVEKYIAGMPLHLRKLARDDAMGQLDDLLTNLTYEEGVALENAKVDREDELSEADALDLRRSSPVVV